MLESVTFSSGPGPAFAFMFGMAIASAMVGAFPPTHETPHLVAPPLLVVGVVLTVAGHRYDSDGIYGAACGCILVAVLICMWWGMRRMEDKP